MRIFIAGGAGYVGSPLVYRLLASGHDVTVFDRLNFGAEALVPLLGQKKFKLIQGDVRDVDAVRNHIQGHDAVCLLAAIVGEPACNRDPALAVETNLVGARNVLNASLASGIERFVFVSTCSNYGVVDGDHLVDELAELQPISTYAETKVQFEQELLQVEQEHFHPTVLRLSTAFGISPRMRFDLMVSDFALAAVKQQKIVVFGEQFWRPFVHVADIAAAIELSIDAPLSVVTNQVFNIGDSNNNLQKLDLAKLVLKYVEGAELETVTRNTDPRSYRVDFTKAKERLGFSAQWSVEDGVREVVDALKTGVWQSPSDPRYYN
jgi:nucleoside-diphosphate-sugar epimerase